MFSITSMPTIEHEFPLELIRHAPELAAWLFGRTAGTPMPEFERARCDASEATTTAPPELRADSVIVLEGRDDQQGMPVQAIVIECQNSRDAGKRFTWPVYVTNVRARLRCPVVLLVVTPTKSLASWCAEPIDAGGGYLIHRPLTMALDALPLVTTMAEARAQPERTVFAAFARCHRDPSVLDVVPAALAVLAQDKGTLYPDHIMAALSGVARKRLEEQVKIFEDKYKTDLFAAPYREGRAEGITEGMATSVLNVLEARGIDVDADARARIMDCSDEEQLGAWLRCALTITTTDELFA